MTFAETLRRGQIGEGRIAQWAIARGYNVLPVYDVEIDSGKGPRLYTTDGQLIALDLFVFHPDNHVAQWIEAKTKSVFSWYRKTQQWVTGIDIRHYEDYLQVAERSPWPVWLLFLHTDDHSDKRPDEPWPCPTGLFGQRIDRLKDCENHRDDRWGRSGMVYWAHEDLKLLATLDEV